MNNAPLGKSTQTPTHAQAYAHPILLCSQLGIQSRPSPRAPKVMTAINPNNANLLKQNQLNPSIHLIHNNNK